MKSIDFLVTDTFKNENGNMAKEDYDRLLLDIMEGKGKIISGGAGLRTIKCGLSERKQKAPNWRVVYAMYSRYNLVVLLAKYQKIMSPKKFNLRHRNQLAQAKQHLDLAIKHRFSGSTKGDRL